MKIVNDYSEAVEVEFGLFAVLLADGGWSIADGMGTKLTPEDETELSGYHLPIRFKSKEEAVISIKTGPHSLFDIDVDSDWSVHALNTGGTLKAAYLI